MELAVLISQALGKLLLPELRHIFIEIEKLLAGRRTM
jgi:hypothetical protein